jgi:hypothetical protein
MSDDDTEFEYPPEWTIPGVEPPRRRSYAPPLRSGLGYTGDEPPADDRGYPEHWRR